jgi:hypothetical protein
MIKVRLKLIAPLENFSNLYSPESGQLIRSTAIKIGKRIIAPESQNKNIILNISIL